VWACIVARLRSARLPGKALIEIAGLPAIAHLLRRVAQIPGLAGAVLCTTTAEEDEAIAALGARENVRVHRGPVLDVLGRMIGALEGCAADVVLRITGDDILVDPDYAAAAVRHHLACNAEYTDLKALPSGTEVEVFDRALLERLWSAARFREGTEYLTSYVTAQRDQFRTASAPVAARHARDWRLTLDTDEDLAVLRALLEAMQAAGKALDYRMDDIVGFFDAHPEVLALNAAVRQRATPIEVSVELDWARMGARARAGVAA
jgi:spore coat polysaccharide biosynthesis protein SpsF (cytidylyltransferase family)